MLKDISGEEMSSAIKSVYAGEKHFSQEVAAVLAQQELDKSKNKLINREQLILRLISRGCSNKKK